ncbi:MAG: 4'-phosphopantetheinyl transferase superfamily protein [Synechococcaceae cyanobacterium]|nr:4'-phosphopantetheinyl transferase superfamily protein [Synechococcaceae cyanobacterium]
MTRLEPLRDCWPAAGTDPSLPALRRCRAADPPLLLCLDRRDGGPAPGPEGLLDGLSPEELQRHAAYRQPADRERFRLGRALLRHWLGLWHGLPPRAVTLAIGSNGKPFCPGGPEFNLSHSGDLILLALHPCRAVGVDVERHRPELDWEPIARRLWGESRALELSRLPAAQAGQAFLQQWCRFEAAAKATGLGLAASGSGATEQACRLWDLLLPDDHLGAVALLADSTDR